MERGQGVGNLSEDLHLKKQRENSLRYRFGKSASAAILATSAISFPVQSFEPQLETESLTKATLIREEFPSSEIGKKPEIVAYDHTFDFKAYKALRDLPPDVVDAEKIRLDSYTDKQLQTILAERLNVLTNTFYYEMKDEELWGKDMNEPALESYKRGRDYRRKYGNPIDWQREDAEIEGFQEIQNMLREGKSVLSISSRGKDGSTYQHNFYDVFMWKDGKIEVNRFSSGLSIEEYKKILGISYEFTDADFLASPIDITGVFDKAEDVHSFFHKDHVYTDTHFFKNVILPSTMQLRQGALRALYEGDEYGFAINFNGSFNLADDLSYQHRNNSDKVVLILPLVLSEREISELGHREVEEKAVGCGTSSGVKLHKTLATQLVEESKLSVKEFADHNKECEDCKQTSADNHYHCPGCNKKYADETSKDDRTQECVCGFEFGCKKS